MISRWQPSYQTGLTTRSWGTQGASPGTTPCPRPGSHGQNGSHHVEGGDEDAQLGDERRQEEGPGWLAVRFPVAKHLQAPEKELSLPQPLPTAPGHNRFSHRPSGPSAMPVLTESSFPDSPSLGLSALDEA